jgi:transcriptional regulator with GAF, ATPase, and Fis domain
LSESNSSQRSTSSSLATKKSKRNTKKLEKKKYVLKEGSLDEDIQLIYAITQIIKSTDRMQEEVSLLVRTLYDFCYIEESIKIQKEFSDLLELIHLIIKDIWIQNHSQSNDFSQIHHISGIVLNYI